MEIKIFNEIYGCYYSTIFHILKEASNKEYKYQEFLRLVRKSSYVYGFNRTTELITGKAIISGTEPENDKNEEKAKDVWPFFSKVDSIYCNSDREEKIKSRLRNIRTYPLSTIERMWIKSIYSNPRIKLFIGDGEEPDEIKDIEPLFDWNDYVLFDKYADGDPFEDEHYIENFTKVLKGVHNRARMEIKIKKQNNRITYKNNGSLDIKPDCGIGTVYIDADYLEFSERDDRFRLIGNNPRFGRNMVNISSIISCKEVEPIDTFVYEKNADSKSNDDYKKIVIFELSDEFNALERFLLTFSHYEKELDYFEKDNLYRIKLVYDETDETDLVIRTLSFGPYVKVSEPDSFVELIRERLKKQLEFKNG